MPTEYEDFHMTADEAYGDPSHQNSVYCLLAFIFVLSLCCASCGLFGSYATLDAIPEYSFDDLERRAYRLYLTGYDPLMMDHARAAWIANHGEPQRIEVVSVESDGIVHTVATVLVQRNDQHQLDLIVFRKEGLVQNYWANDTSRTAPLTKYSFSDAAVDIDPTLYPRTVEEIPESFLE